MLSGQSSHTAGAPGFNRVGGAGHGRQRLVVDIDQLSGVLWASASVSAITIATGSPT